MKVKRLFVILAIVCTLAIFPFSKPDAALWTWYTCNVIAIEAGAGQNWIELTEVNGNFSQVWFSIDQTQANQILAMTMFAMANGKQVQIWVPDTQSLTTIQYINLLN